MSDNIMNNDSGVIKPDFPDVPKIDVNSPLPPFKAWVQMAIPTVYDESLSYAELLYKVINYLNVTNAHLTTNDESIKKFYDFMYGYDKEIEGETVHINGMYDDIVHWFDNLIVDDEVDTKVQQILDTWAEDDTLVTLMSPTIIAATDAWLPTKITQTTLNALDNTLLLANAGANSKAAGDAIFGDMNDSNIRPYISSACPKTYHFFSQMYGNPLNITNIKNMGRDSCVWVDVTSGNINNVKNFISYTENGVIKYPINITTGNQYLISKNHLFDRVLSDENTVDVNIYIIRNLITNEIVHGYLYEVSNSPQNIQWFKNTDTTLLKNNVGADSKSVGDAIFRELNTVNTRNRVTNSGLLKYIYSSATQAITDLHNIGVDSPYDMVNGSCVSLAEISSLRNMSSFLGGQFTPSDGLSTGGYYTLEKRHIYSSSSMFILYTSNGNHIYYGLGQPDTSADPPYKITWGEDVGSESINSKINTAIYATRTNITPLPFAKYVPESTPFNPWQMPENTIYYGAPTAWYEDSQNNAFINLDRSLFEKATSTDTPKELVGTTYQLIRSRYGLEIICGFRKQFFYGNKAGTIETWGTVGVENSVSINNQYTQTIQTTEIINSGDINITPTITTDTNNFLAATGTTADRTTDILGMLNTGCCILGCGRFYVHDLQMPDFSCLKGCGNATEIVWKNVEGSTCIIKMGHNCTIENLKINAEGRSPANHFNPFYETTDTTADDEKEIPNFSAILYSNTAHQYPLEYINQSKISNITIINCNGIGIKTINSTMDVDRNLIVVNCQIRDCVCGIYNDINSEFHKFTNVIVTHCFYGAIIHGGNIFYTNCSIGACHMCVKLGADYGNNSHGLFSACIFAHTANIYGESPTEDSEHRPIGADNGYFINALNITHGERFIGCTFGFGKISIKSCVGLALINSWMKTAKINVYGDTTNGASVATLFNGLTVNNVQLTIGEYASNTNIINCFTTQGTPWNG